MQVYFEFQQIGNTMKVTAIDADTGTEVVIQGYASSNQHTLEQAAAKKLLYVLEKKKGG